MSRLLSIHINCLKKLDEEQWSENWTFSRAVHQKLIDKGLAKRSKAKRNSLGQLEFNYMWDGPTIEVYKRTKHGSAYLANRAQRRQQKGRIS